MSNMFHWPFRPAIDSAGVSVPGAQLYFTNTSDDAPTSPYQDEARAIPHTNPVVTDGAGKIPPIYLNPAVTYRVRVYDRTGEAGVGTPLEDFNPYVPGILDEGSLSPIADAAAASAAAASDYADQAATTVADGETSINAIIANGETSINGIIAGGEADVGALVAEAETARDTTLGYKNDAQGAASSAAISATSAAASKTAADADAATASTARSGAEAAEAGTLAALSGTSLSNATLNAASRAVLAALDRTLGLPAILTEPGREGTFVFDSSNLSAQVTADTAQGIYVAPSTDTSGASGAWVRVASDVIEAIKFGVSALSTDNYAAINAARTVANLLKKPLLLPPGTLILDQAAPTFTLSDDEQIIGSGNGRTTIHVTDTLNSSASIFTATAKSRIRLANFRLEANSTRTSANIAVNLLDCNDCVVEGVTFDKWTQSVVFNSSSTSLIPPQTTNARNKAIRCVVLSGRSYGFFMQFSTACEFLFCESYNSSNQDGFKFGGGNMFARVIGCHSEGNVQDGFDTYDGFISSVIEGCTSYNNGINGFQFKGTLGGTYTAGDYVNRDSVYSNLTAKGNAAAGFLFQEMRNGVATGLVAVGNATSGLVLNNIQGMSFAGCSANRNTQHGWGLINGTSRCTFSSCQAIDNSYVDGTTQNATFDGWNLNTASGCNFIGCLGYNGTQSGKLGGQGYGFNTTTSTGNRFVGCGAASNVTAAVGGTTPFVSNQFTALDMAGVFYNLTPQVQAVVSASTVTPSFSNELVKITAQAANLSLGNPTGTALPGKVIRVRIKDNGTSRTIGYGTQYRAIGVTLPTATTISKTIYLTMVYNSDDTKWDVIDVKQEA